MLSKPPVRALLVDLTAVRHLCDLHADCAKAKLVSRQMIWLFEPLSIEQSDLD